MKRNYPKVLAILTLLATVIFIGLLLMDMAVLRSPMLLAALGFFALYCMLHPALKKIAFTSWVLVFVAASLTYPAAFGAWFGIDLKILIVPLIQVIMFGMGTTLSVQDFTRVIAMPWPVFVGFFLQYSIMPLVGLSIATLLGFEPEIAAGVILIGSCPGGVASNLMTYLAGGNVALSVTMTSCSTLASPVMTPFLMQSLAGKLVPIDFTAMMLSILNMIIVPIVAGLAANRILYSKKAAYGRSGWLGFITALGLSLAAVFMLVKTPGLGTLEPLRTGIVLGFALIGIVALVKWLVNNVLTGPENWMDKALPVVSMAGICFIIAIITARSSQDLLSTGLVLMAAAIAHNTIGYLLGYWLARALRLDESTARTVAFEVGMQNGGMASGLAMTVLNSSKAAIAPAIFGPWMNVSGSILATWWHRRPVRMKEK